MAGCQGWVDEGRVECRGAEREGLCGENFVALRVPRHDWRAVGPRTDVLEIEFGLGVKRRAVGRARAFGKGKGQMSKIQTGGQAQGRDRERVKEVSRRSTALR